MRFLRHAAAALLAAALAAGAAGCATEHYELDAKHPVAEMAEDGMIGFRGRFYSPEEFPKALRRAHVSKDQTINIRVSDRLANVGMMRRARALIGKAGYHRVIFNSVPRSSSYQADGVDPMKNPGYNFPPGEKVYGAGW